MIPFITNGQVNVGLGINVGYKNLGPKIELNLLEHYRVEAGLNWSRYNIFSNYFGIKYGIKGSTNKYNTYLGLNYEYRYSGQTVLELDDEFYRYKINNLQYLVPSIGFSRRIESDLSNKPNKFALIELSLSYRYLINPLNIIPDINNHKESQIIEDGLRSFFADGIGAHIGITFFL
jgi:hypothetical protein